MRTEEVTIVVDADGQVSVQVSGVKGKSCLDVTKELERLLGGEVDRTPTEEMHQLALRPHLVRH